MKYFPVFLQVEDRSAFVFGGGADAAAKLRLLQKTEAKLFVVAEQIEAEVLDLGQATWIKAAPLDVDLPANTALIYAATGDEELDRRLAEKAQAQGVLACAVDQMGPSDFLTPALVDRDPLVVAIGTEGTAPVLARDVKATIESLLEPGLGHIARAAAALRPLVARLTRPGGQRRDFWHAFFAKAQKSPAQAAQIGQRQLKTLEQPEAKLVYLDAPQGQGNLDTAARAALHRADVVISDASTDPKVLELARREALQIRQAHLTRTHLTQAFENHELVVLIEGPTNSDWINQVAEDLAVPVERHTQSPVPQPLPLAA